MSKKLMLLLTALIINLFGQDSLLLNGVPTWRQDWPFNMYCPIDTSASGKRKSYNGHFPAGCGPTAISQVVRYYRNPDRGWGEISYVTSTGLSLGMNFDTCVYNWKNIPLTLDTLTPYIEQQSTAFLIYSIGLMCKTDYKPFGSSTTGYTILDYTTHFLHLSGNVSIYDRNKLSDNAWNALIIRELNALRPVCLMADSDSTGHMFVIDGYKKENDRYYYHINGGTGKPGFFALMDSVSFENELYNSDQSIFAPFAPAKVPEPDNFRYSKEGNYLVFRWDAVNDSQVCGYEMYRWNERPRGCVKWKCDASKTFFYVVDYRDTVSVKKFFPDTIDKLTLNVVSICNDSTSSILSDTLSITREEYLTGIKSLPGKNKHLSKCPEIRIARHSITIYGIDGILQEINVFNAKGSLVKSVVCPLINEFNYSIPFDRTGISASFLFVQLKFSDGYVVNKTLLSAF